MDREAQGPSHQQLAPPLLPLTETSHLTGKGERARDLPTFGVHDHFVHHLNVSSKRQGKVDIKAPVLIAFPCEAQLGRPSYKAPTLDPSPAVRCTRVLK